MCTQTLGPLELKKKPAKNTPFKSPIHRYPMDEIVLSNCALPAPHLEWFSCSPPHSYNYAAIWWALVSVYRMATETRKVGVQDGHSTIMASADMASTPAIQHQQSQNGNTLHVGFGTDATHKNWRICRNKWIIQFWMSQYLIGCVSLFQALCRTVLASAWECMCVPDWLQKVKANWN